MDEKPDSEIRFVSFSRMRYVFFFLGVFLAAAVGLAIALAVVALKDDDNDSSFASAGGGSDKGRVGTSPSFVLRAGELLAAMDRTVDPCQDFYQYSCGNWLRTHGIPDGESDYGTFSELSQMVRLELKGLLEQPYDNNTDSSSIRKAKLLYQSCVDEDKLDELGTEPMKRLVDELGTWPLTSGGSFNPSLDLESVLLKLGRIEMFPLIDVGVFQDEENSSMYITWVDQGSFDMDRSYLIKGRNSTEVKAYEELLRQLALHVLNVPNSDSLVQDIGDVVEFQTELAKISASRTERRNVEKFYRKTTVAGLQADVPKFPWLPFLTAVFRPVNITVTNDTQIAQFAEDYLNNMLDLYHKTDKRTAANYLLMSVVAERSSFLSKKIRDLRVPLKKVLYGVSETRARWKSCVDSVRETFMPTAVGQLYVTNYFSSAAKQKVLEMIDYIRESMKQMVNDVTWMDDVTKAKAQEKADAMIKKIGFPDYQFNETKLEELYRNVDYKPDTYFQNGLDYYRAAVKRNLLKLNKAPNKQSWTDISASTVNAFYSPSDNAIIFPAGILQPPFYAEDFPASMMFGGIGSVIGHEITHGFDDSGRKYDKDGNNVPWWSESSVRQYQDLAKCYVDQYSKNIVSGLHLNGNLTLGENIADNGGLKAAFMAFQKWQSNNEEELLLPGLGLTHKQLFFVNFALTWCELTTEESARDRVLTDTHSPDPLRVRIPVGNFPHFADAFNCSVGSPMNPIDKCHLW